MSTEQPEQPQQPSSPLRQKLDRAVLDARQRVANCERQLRLARQELHEAEEAMKLYESNADGMERLFAALRRLDAMYG